MPQPPLREGERVRLCAFIWANVRIGTLGTIIRVYPPDATVITVRFDGHTRLLFLRAADVERLGDIPA